MWRCRWWFVSMAARFWLVLSCDHAATGSRLTARTSTLLHCAPIGTHMAVSTIYRALQGASLSC